MLFFNLQLCRGRTWRSWQLGSAVVMIWALRLFALRAAASTFPATQGLLATRSIYSEVRSAAAPPPNSVHACATVPH